MPYLLWQLILIPSAVVVCLLVDHYWLSPYLLKRYERRYANKAWRKVEAAQQLADEAYARYLERK
jgi:hypothetical protein